MGTRSRCTVIDIDGAGVPIPPRWALALKAGGDLVAGAPICTRVGYTRMLGDLTGLARISFGTCALVFIGFSVHASPSIDAGVMRPAVIQVFVTQQTSPVGFAVTLPRLHTRPVDTAWVWDTLVTELSLPSIQARAFPRNNAFSMDRMTALLTYSFLALIAHPAFHTDLVPILVTQRVAEEVIAGPAELLAAGAVVVVFTPHADAVLKVGHRPVVLESHP